MKITIELNEDQDKKVELYKAAKSLPSKADAIAKMIDEFNIKIDIKV
jgi:hypothetical protein